jgi:hypothetical protein
MLVVLLGEGDIRRYVNYGGRAAGELAAYGGMIGEPENTFFWYFDLPKPPQSLIIHHGTSRTIAPLDSIKGLPELLRPLNIPYSFAVPFNELYKLGFAGGPAILRFTQEQEMKALYFTGAGPAERAGLPRGAGPAGRTGQSLSDAGGTAAPVYVPAGLSAETLAELILSYAASLEPPGESQDYHYLIFPLPGTRIFLSQKHIALLLLIIAAVFFSGLLLNLGFRRPPPAETLIFFRCLWVAGGYFLLFFAAFEGAGLAVSLIPEKWKTSNLLLYGWVILKLILSLGIFALISIPLGNYRIPRRAKFYGTASLLLIILDIFIAAWADICFIPFFLGALFLILLGTRFKRPVPVYICAVLSPFYGILAGTFSAFSGHRGLGEFLLSNRPGSAAVMILAFLPFVLLFKRGISLGRRGKADLRRRLVPCAILFGLGLILGAVLCAAASQNLSV